MLKISLWHGGHMSRKYVVQLNDAQRLQLSRMLRRGRESAWKLMRARVLLKADEGQTDEEVAEAVEVSTRSVARVRRRFCDGGIDTALRSRPQPPRPGKRKIDGENEAKLIAIACSAAPPGHDHWTLQLLADRMVRLKYVDEVSPQTVRRVLKKTRSSRG
jgi:transposase